MELQYFRWAPNRLFHNGGGRSCLESFAIIGQGLHHFFPLRHELGIVLCCPDGITLSMGQQTIPRKTLHLSKRDFFHFVSLSKDHKVLVHFLDPLINQLNKFLV
jgi:hypothetical protein